MILYPSNHAEAEDQPFKISVTQDISWLPKIEIGHYPSESGTVMNVNLRQNDRVCRLKQATPSPQEFEGFLVLRFTHTGLAGAAGSLEGANNPSVQTSPGA